MKAILSFLAGALLATGLGAAEYRADRETLQFGPLPPQLVADDSFKFTASDRNAQAAQFKQPIDFTKGVRIEFEFMAELKQSNPFARLIEIGDISIHLVVDENSDEAHVVKALLTAPDKGYAQLFAPIRRRPGDWNRLVFTYEPAGKCFTLQLDGEARKTLAVPAGFAPRQTRLTVGATALARSDRGYSGSLRHLRVTAPYDGGTTVPSAVVATPKSPDGTPIRHFVISRVRHRHHAFPGAAILPNGDLAVVFREGESHVCPYGRICIVYSKDGGRNFSAPVAIADTASDERDPSIHALKDGRVLVTHGGWNSWMGSKREREHYAGATAYLEQAGPKNFGGSRYLFSDDNGENWSRPVKIPAFSPHGPAVDEDGFFYQPTLANEGGKRQVYMYRGTPDGKSWEKLGLVGESERGNVAVTPVFEEPHSVFLPDGTLLTAIRVPADGFMRISFSPDKGRTWSEPVQTPVKGYPQHLLPLADGRLLCTYGYRFPPMGVRACFSADGGKTWELKNEVVIQNNGTGDLGYPVSLALPDGKILTVYYTTNRHHPEAHIEGAVWTP